MAGIFYGSMYGGSTTAILLNIPGESASVVTAIDGYQLAGEGPRRCDADHRRGRLFVGGTLAVIGVMLFSSHARQCRDPVRTCGIFSRSTAGGLVVMSRISGGTLASALLPMTLGLMLGTIGRRPSPAKRASPSGSWISPRACRWSRSWSGSTALPN